MVSRREFNRREQRGLAIVAKGGMIKRTDDNTILVKSSDLQRSYKVFWSGIVFEGTKLKPLLTQFMRMIISRADRLLSSSETSCEHSFELKNWTPNQQQLQETVSDFSKGVIETLPTIVKAVVAMLNGEQVKNVENKYKIGT